MKPGTKKAWIIVAAVLLAFAVTVLLERGQSQSAAGVLFLGKPDCSGIAARPADEAWCAVRIALRGSNLPGIEGAAAAALESVDVTRVKSVDLSRCLPRPPSGAAASGEPSEPDGGVSAAAPCRVHDGVAEGLSLANRSKDASANVTLGVTHIDALLEPVSPPSGRRDLWLFATSANAIALIDETKLLRKTEIVVRPERGATLSVVKVPALPATPLAADVASRILALSPGDGAVRVNLEWRTAPPSLWRNVRLASISGPLSGGEPSRFHWLGQEHTLSNGTISVEAQDLEADVAPSCDGKCFKISFSASNPVISAQGASVPGKRVVWRRWFETFAAIFAVTVAVAGLILQK